MLIADFDLDSHDDGVWTFPYPVTCPECGAVTMTGRASATLNGTAYAVCPTCGLSLGDVQENVWNGEREDAARIDRAADTGDDETTSNE